MLTRLIQGEDRSHAVSLVAALADYAAASRVISDPIIGMARLSLIEALGHGFEALRDPQRASLIGPLVPGALMPGGARVPGSSLELDPARAAFCNGLLFYRPEGDRRQPDHWQDLCSGYAADPLGAILAVADYQARKAMMEGTPPPRVREVLAAMVKALQIQSTLAFEGGCQDTGNATLRIVRVAVAAVTAAQLGGTQGQIATALSHTCVDGAMSIDAQEQYGSARWAWITADSISRAVRHACHATAAGGPSYLTAAEVNVMDFAGNSLGVRPLAARRRFDSDSLDPLAGLYRPHEITRLVTRFQTAVGQHFPPRQAERIKSLFAMPEQLDELPVNELLASLVTNGALARPGTLARQRHG